MLDDRKDVCGNLLSKGGWDECISVVRWTELCHGEIG